jgi:MoaA/NifB/PqqE/SkfB family radical SAM enzyme
VLRKLNSAVVGFSGGEPTYHPDFEKIVKEKPPGIDITLVSNGARPLSFWERISDKLNQVILTYHTEFANLDRFYKNAELIYKTKGVRGVVNLTMMPDRWDECVKVYEFLTTRDINVNIKPILDQFGTSSSKVSNYYSTEQTEWITYRSGLREDDNYAIGVYSSDQSMITKITPSEILAENQANFTGWRCFAPKDSLFINLDGKVWDSLCGQKQYLGDIYTEFSLERKEPVICTQTVCWCHSDLLVRKEKIINFVRKDNI